MPGRARLAPGAILPGEALTGIAGRAAVVTGAGQGLGEAIACSLAAAGAHVVCADRNPATAERTAGAMREAGGRAQAVAADVAQRADARRMIQAALDATGRVDILVNVAGILRVGPVLELTDARWDETFAVNVKGAFLCSQEAGRIMAGQRSGTVVSTASTAAVVPRVDQAAYGASEAAVAHLTRCLGLELATYGVRVNAVCPGIARTPMWAELTRGSLGLEAALAGGALEKFRLGVPLGRMVEPRTWRTPCAGWSATRLGTNRGSW